MNLKNWRQSGFAGMAALLLAVGLTTDALAAPSSGDARGGRGRESICE